MPIINSFTKKIVRIGDKCILPGNMPMEVTSFRDGSLCLTGPNNFTFTVPFATLSLETIARMEPSLLMTEDDWTRAANTAEKTGSGFMSALALAYLRADGGNRPPIKREYHMHFFGFLSQERQQQLRQEAE